MSHTVTVTRMTTTSSSPMVINTGYACNIQGALKILETVFGAICLGLMLHYTKHGNVDSFGMPGHELYFLLTAFGCLLCTFLLLVSSCWSFTSSSLLSRTSFEILFHVVACALYLAAGITLLTKTLDYDRRFRGGEKYDARIAAAVFGIMNGALYLIGAILSVRIFRLG
uniref:Putative members of chemokine-like factor super family n=1 Tax=Amblyomma sculptum TaxID=1581419 RepID=A0A1E1XR08_AMBSC